MTSESAEPDTVDTKRSWVDALYRKYSQALSAFLTRQRVRPEEVADIVQETYCRVQQTGNVDTIRNPKAFLFRVACNIRFNERQRRRRHIQENRLDIESVDLASDEPSPYRSFKGTQDLENVRAAFAELSEPCRQAFVMNRFQDLTYVQIAARLGISVSMVEKHVARAVAHMKSSLEGQRKSAPHESLRLLK